MAKEKERNRGNLAVFIIVICVLVVIALSGYYKIMKKQVSQSNQAPRTEPEKLIAKDLDLGYPDTPSEVMKLWGRYNQCMYNNALGDEQFNALLKQLRMMYSSELLAVNEESSHGAKLRAEIEEFQNNKSKIVSYSPDTGKTVQYKTINGKECAYLKISYFISKKTGYSKVFEDFILVKEDDKWKILGFQFDNSSDSGNIAPTKS